MVVFGVLYECGQDLILLSGAVGISASALLIIVDKGMSLTSKRRAVSLNLQDYLENFLKVRLEQETFHPELLEQYRQEYFQSIETDKQISTTSDQTKLEAKDELKRRREARRKKEEERRLQLMKREEEQRKIEQARREEEKRKIEERKLLAAKRREEERLNLEEERKALEARRTESRKKSEDKQLINDRKQHQMEVKDKILQSMEEDLNTKAEESDMDMLMQSIQEMAAEKERLEHEREKKGIKQRSSDELNISQGMSDQEEKLIEDVLKEFFA